MPEVTNAFAMSPEDFKQKYGFSMPEKSADNIIVGCLFAIRSKEAGLFLQKIGYNTIRWSLQSSLIKLQQSAYLYSLYFFI